MMKMIEKSVHIGTVVVARPGSSDLNRIAQA
jgi:hypothetical protein